MDGLRQTKAGKIPIGYVIKYMCMMSNLFAEFLNADSLSCNLGSCVCAFYLLRISTGAFCCCLPLAQEACIHSHSPNPRIGQSSAASDRPKREEPVRLSGVQVYLGLTHSTDSCLEHDSTKLNVQHDLAHSTFSIYQFLLTNAGLLSFHISIQEKVTVCAAECAQSNWHFDICLIKWPERFCQAVAIFEQLSFAQPWIWLRLGHGNSAFRRRSSWCDENIMCTVHPCVPSRHLHEDLVCVTGFQSSESGILRRSTSYNHSFFFRGIKSQVEDLDGFFCLSYIA